MTQDDQNIKGFLKSEAFPFLSAPFKRSELGKKLLYSILFFSTIITIFLTSIQIYFDYRAGLKNIYDTVDQIKITQLESLAQNLWNINNEQIQIQLKGLLEIETVNSLTIFPKDDDPIKLSKNVRSFKEIVTNYPIIYQREGKEINLGTLRIISDISPVVNSLKSRVLIILLSQGAKTFIVSLFILFIFNVLVSKHLIAVSRFARETSLDNIGKQLVLNRAPQEKADELDELASNLNLMQEKIRREVIQRKAFQDQLLQSQKMEALGTLASGIAHDFNNILQGLYNALFLIEEEVIDNADALSRLNTANHLVDRARELVKQILIYTKQEEGIFNQFSPISPIQDVVEILRAARNSQVTIDLFIDPPNGNIYGDKTQLKQVLLNLGNNALQALDGISNPKLKIFISSEAFFSSPPSQLEAGDYLVIKVTDNGIGMSEEVKERIFEPFFTTKDIDKGTGLGLSVVQGIIQRHNGHIEVQSTKGQGTTFTIYLPLILKKGEERLHPYLGDEFIHIVGDNSDVTTPLKDLLQNRGHHISVSESAQETLDNIKERVKRKPNQSQILIIDQSINDFSPEELARKVRQFFKDIPILYLSDKNTSLPFYLRIADIQREHFLEGIPTFKKESKSFNKIMQSAFDLLD